MSNKVQLQTNNTALDALITRVNAAKNTAASLPEAGGSGGEVSVKTCTVTFNVTSNGYLTCDPQVYYVTSKDGILSIETCYFNSIAVRHYQCILQNVVCESMISIIDDSWALPSNSNTIEGTAQIFDITGSHAIILSPTVEGENCSITING